MDQLVIERKVRHWYHRASKETRGNIEKAARYLTIAVKYNELLRRIKGTDK